jgi:hypothetical protein
MKKILFVVLFSFLFAPLAVSATEYYCKCPTSDPGKMSCHGGFSDQAAMQADCPSCVQMEGNLKSDLDCAEEAASTLTIPSGGSTDFGKTVKLSNPLVGNVTDVNAIIGNIIKAATGVMGALVLLMIVWGGVTWLTAAGNPEKIKSGSNTIMWAILGAVVVLGSYLLLTAVLKALAG